MNYGQLVAYTWYSLATHVNEHPFVIYRTFFVASSFCKYVLSSHPLLRVGTPLPYFITELLYQPMDQLEDTHSIPLHVVTLHPPDPPSSTTGDRSTIPPSLNEPPPPESSSPDGVKRCKLDSPPPHALVAAGGVASRDSVTGSAMAAGEVMRRHPAWILDIDLDFFSTGNPFKSIFTEVRAYLVDGGGSI